MSAAYIFDVEGTLIDCVPQILRCWHETLASFGVPMPMVSLQRLSGMDGDEMLAMLAAQLRRKCTKENIGRARRALSRGLSAAGAGVSRRARGFHRDQVARRPHRACHRLSKRRIETLSQPAQCRRYDRRHRLWRSGLKGQARARLDRTGARSSRWHVSGVSDHDRGYPVRCSGRAACRHERVGNTYRRSFQIVADRCGLFRRGVLGCRFAAMHRARSAGRPGFGAAVNSGRTGSR